jgi:type IV fimbrial biogenesis protein FimT
MSLQRGFTLIELMVTVAILAIVLVIAVPSFETTVNANRLMSAANEMVNSLQTARMEAIRRNEHAGMCLSANAGSATPTCASSNVNGWITFVDADRDGSFSSGDTLLMTTTLPPAVQARSNAALTSAVVFHTDGRARDGDGALLDAVIAMSIPTRHPGDNVHRVDIGAGSRISASSEPGGGACTAPADPS